MQKKYFLFYGIILIMLTGCQQHMYIWGDYEKIIHSNYKNPESVNTLSEIDHIENNIILEANMQQKKVPPGIYSHLAVLYMKVGKTDKALESFSKEKQLFPESEVFVNGMMRRAGVQ